MKLGKEVTKYKSKNTPMEKFTLEAMGGCSIYNTTA